ncbi:hypothetical protein [uncultured Sneathiella sp.]|uniref:hypothetical protein n=1 Tax=uncultured Sneathiella sp. TaxID=879315 RepID=UPI002594F43B|nr:hypothetical protein [uncultured Sneathiella sp.]
MPSFFIHKGITPSNKTEKYRLQLSADVNAYGYKNNKGYRVNILYPVIDKLSVTIPVDEEYRKAVDGSLYKIHKQVKDFSDISKNGKKYHVSANWTDKVTGQKVLFQCNPKSSKAVNYMRFELNPNKLGPDGMRRFKSILELLVTYGNYPYSRILEEGYITRMDIAVDIVNVAPHELIISGKDKGKSIKFLGKGSNELETVYLDKPKTKSSQKMIYDKLQEQVDKGNKPSFNEVLHTRAEYTHAGAPFSNIPNIKNPFKKMKVIHPIFKPDGVEDWIWQLFLNSCRLKGVEASLSLLPDHLRASHRKALEKAAEVTWRPEMLMDKWKDYLIKSKVLTSD